MAETIGEAKARVKAAGGLLSGESLWDAMERLKERQRLIDAGWTPPVTPTENGDTNDAVS